MNDAEDVIDGICEMFGLDGSLFKDTQLTVMNSQFA